MTIVSIITINFNNKDGLLKTLNSINSLNNNINVELIIIDGNSTDGSRELLFNTTFPITTKIVSENDSGIYNAMNKGIKNANGKYVLFLNSGDILYNQNNFEKFFNTKLDSKVDVYLFDFFYNNKKRKAKPIWWRFWSLPTSHQSILYKKSILDYINYDENFRFAADFKHFIDITKLNLRFKYVNEILSMNESYGSDKFIYEVKKEYYKILLDNTNIYVAFLINWFKFFYIIMRKKLLWI